MEKFKPDYQEILKRIHTTPSVLFLGQSYLTEALSVSQVADSSGKKEQADELQCLLNYREILSLRWNTIVSSSYDANIPNKCGDSFSFESRYIYKSDQKIDKTVKSGYFLFGQDDKCSTSSKPDLDLDSSSKDLFVNVIKNIIKSYGILIISGWDIDSDWFTPNVMYEVLKNAPEGSVLLFGVNREKALNNKFIKELTKKQLYESNIIEDTFYLFLQKHGFFDEQYEDDDFSTNNDSGTLSLYSDDYKKGRIPFVLSIDNDAIYELKSHSITLITDQTGSGSLTKNDENLLRFCTGKGDWAYYAPYNNFFINRNLSVEKDGKESTEDFSEHISKAIANVAKKSKKRSNFICISGIHYSGKTTLLKNFALKNKNKYPILYIENYTDELTENLLKNFCSNYVNLPEEFTREVILLCDFKTSSDYDMQRICLQINNKISEIAGLIPIVIGTVYSDYLFNHSNVKMLHLSHELSGEELREFISIYGATEKYHLLTSSGNSIFEIITRLYRYKFSPEYAELRAEMQKSQIKNQESARENFDVAYTQIYDEIFDNFIKSGILSSYKNSLDENDENSNKVKFNLIKINDCIALASEFGIDLPNDFVLRTFGWNNYKFLEALNADCFLKQTETGYRYISAYEAGKYLLLNYTDNSATNVDKEMQLKKRDVEILCEIIENCNWSDFDESAVVISLIRKFSPNSFGKDYKFFNDDMNLDFRGKDWRYYKEYYEQIGSKLLSYGKNNIIAIVVSSAFLRRAYNYFNVNDKTDLIDKAYNACKEILINESFFGINEQVELYIEICNVIIAIFPHTSSPNRGAFEKWNEFKEYFQHLLDLYDKTEKLAAEVILGIWYRAMDRKAKSSDIDLFEQTLVYESAFLPSIVSEYDFKDLLKDSEKIHKIYSDSFNAEEYKTINLKGWLLYQQREGYKLEKYDTLHESCSIGESELNIAKKIISVFSESDETKKAVSNHPVLLKTKVLCDWIIKFKSSPYAEENPICFEDAIFWHSIYKDIELYFNLYNDKTPPAAFIKYIRCIHSLVFGDGSYRFDNIRYNKRLSPWYLKRIGVADETGSFLKVIIGTKMGRNNENFKGQVFDSNSILKNLNNIHLSSEVQKYLSSGTMRLTVRTSIPEKPVNIFFNAAGATAAIPRDKGGDNA